MADDRRTRLKDVFAELAELPPGSVRDTRLLELCGGDPALQAEVEQLLRFDSDGDELFPGEALRSDLNALWEAQGAFLEDGDPSVSARYEILRPLGEGGFGVVYLAREEEPIPRLVAIKVIKPGMDTREVLSRFDTERRALATMGHPSIARALAAGADKRGRPYFVMEYVEGEPITSFCDAKKLSVRARLELFIEVGQAIQHAHFKGVVHRDIKPANVLVTLVDGRPFPKVIDFGIAKATEPDAAETSGLTRAGQLVGTLASMSPEQARGAGAEVDIRTDVYGLGALVYELLTGAPPFSFDRETAELAGLRERILNEDPPRPSARLPKEVGELEAVAALRGVSGRALQREVSADLDWIVMKALAKEPERRYSTASEFVADLRRYLADEPVTARPPSRSYQAAKFARRHRASLAAATVMLVLLVGGSIGTAVGWRRSVQALEVAREQAHLARSAEAEAAKQARRAQDEAELALAINEFLNHDLLSAVSPEVMGYDVSMGTVLDAAASKIEGRFDSSPRIEHSIRTTLGRTYSALGRVAQAEEQLLAALAVHPARSATDGELSAFDVADVIARGSTRYELARVLLQNNRNAEAEEILRALREEYSSVLGEEAPQTIEALHYLGVSLGEQERFDEAGEAFDAALAHALSALGPDHELTIEALHSQGLLRSSRVNAGGSLTERERGSLNEEAQGFLGDALRASRAAYGPDDPRSVRHSMSLASAKFTAGHEADALKLFEDAYERSRRVQGPEHPTTASAAVAIGKIHLAAGSLTLAEPRLQEAFEATLQLGDVHPVHLHSCYSLATCWLRMGRSEDAERLALSMFEALEREGQPVGTAAILLAEICADSGRYDEAEHWEGLGH